MVVLIVSDGRGMGRTRFEKTLARADVMVAALRVASRFGRRIELIDWLGCSDLIVGNSFCDIRTLTVLVGWLFGHGHRFGSLWIHIVTTRKLSAKRVFERCHNSKRTNC